MLTRALHANALALSRALRFPAPEKADSLESAAAAVTAAHREELRSPANKQPLASPSAAKAKRPAADPAWTGGPRPPPGSYLTDPGPPRSGAPRASFAAIQASMLAPPPPPPPPPAQWHSTVWDALNQKLSKADDDPLARREVVSSTRLRAAARSATPPPPGATPLYISYASRGAATEQQRREFDKAARVARTWAMEKNQETWPGASARANNAPVKKRPSMAAALRPALERVGEEPDDADDRDRDDDLGAAAEGDPPAPPA